jgi:hypothetical protein
VAAAVLSAVALLLAGCGPPIERELILPSPAAAAEGSSVARDVKRLQASGGNDPAELARLQQAARLDALRTPPPSSEADPARRLEWDPRVAREAIARGKGDVLRTGGGGWPETGIGRLNEGPTCIPDGWPTSGLPRLVDLSPIRVGR